MSKVLVNFIQDRSGSMQSVWTETLSGFKSFVTELRDKGKTDGVEYLFSLTTFDTLIETPVIAQPIDAVDVDVLKAHGPRGSTALYDAVGATIKNTEDNPVKADKVIVVIVTDGQENSSREWTKDKLHQAIEAKLNLGNWTFTYLGTQPETWDDAGAIGVSAGSTASYTPSMAHAAYTTTSAALHTMASSSATGSRSLIADFVPDSAARAAGMTTRKTPTPPTSKPKAKTPSTRRWQ